MVLTHAPVPRGAGALPPLFTIMNTDTQLVLLSLVLLVVVSFLTGFCLSSKLSETDQIKQQIQTLTSQLNNVSTSY